MIISYYIIVRQSLNPINKFILNAKFSVLKFLSFYKTLKLTLSVNLQFIFIKTINFILKFKFLKNCLKLILKNSTIFQILFHIDFIE